MAVDLAELRRSLGRGTKTRAQAIDALRTYTRWLTQEKAAAEAALNALTYAPRRPRPTVRPNGTYTVLRAYIRHVRDTCGPGQEITAAAAAKWMLANGWETTSKVHVKTASQGLNNLAKYGELRWVRQGVYQEPEPPAEEGKG